MRGKKGHQTSDWVQPKASFKCKVSYGAGGKRSRKDGIKDGEGRVVGGGHRELEIIASIDEVTLGGFQHD